MKPLKVFIKLFVIAISSFAASDANESIKQLFSFLNSDSSADSPESIASLFLAGADRAEITHLTDVVHELSDGKMPWRELSSRRLNFLPPEFPTPDSAIVHASISPHAPAAANASFVFVLRKVGAKWKIASFRSLKE